MEGKQSCTPVNLRASHTIADNIPLVSCTSFRYTVDYIHKKCVAKSGLKLIFTYLDQDFMGDNSYVETNVIQTEGIFKWTSCA